MSKLDTAEKYGFDRSTFPLSIYGHNVKIMYNDACDHDSGAQIDIRLFCSQCREESCIYTVCDIEAVKVCKLIALHPFMKRCAKS